MKALLEKLLASVNAGAADPSDAIIFDAVRESAADLGVASMIELYGVMSMAAQVNNAAIDNTVVRPAVYRYLKKKIEKKLNQLQSKNPG